MALRVPSRGDVSASARAQEAPNRRSVLRLRPGVFLVGSGVSGFNAPVFLVVAGGVCADFASLGVTSSVLSEPGAPGSAGFSALTGVPARTSIATAKAVAACFICGDLL